MNRIQVTTDWQLAFEGIGGLQNVGGDDMYVYEGDTAPDADSPYVVIGARGVWTNYKTGQSVYVKTHKVPGYVTLFEVTAASGGGSTDVSTLNKEATQLAIKTDIAAFKGSVGFYSTGYTLNANGDVVNESESNGTQTRTRSWAYVTNGDGSVTAMPSAWSFL